MRPLALLLALAAVPVLAGDRNPFDPGEARDAASLDVHVVQDWTDEADPPRRTKIVEITVAEWWAGRTVRIPVAYVAPPEAARFVVLGNIGLKAPKKAPLNDQMRTLLPRGVGFVMVGIGPIEAMEPAEELNDEMNQQFLSSKGDARYSPAWIWGMSYMRALTAALTEDDAFRPVNVAVSGGSKRGVASAACGIWDDRFTAFAPVVAPPYVAPSGLFAWPPDPAAVREANERFLAAVRDGGSTLPAEVRDNILAFEQRNERFKLSLDDLRKAGFSDDDIQLAAQRIDALYLLSENTPAAHRPGVEWLYVNGTNDNVTPGVLATSRRYPAWNVLLLPGGQHGSAGFGFERRTPTAPETVATVQAFFEHHFFGEPTLPAKPKLLAAQSGDELYVAVEFPAEGPAPEEGTIHWSFDRPPAGTWDYQYSQWGEAKLERVSERGWEAYIPVKAGARSVDVLSLHGAAGAFVSSNLRRIELGR
ncbi:MAG: hypothetical protein H6509_00080 [Bryobacterales bacterium]|nr:hypothetical protein [Bryobacterales bacterium]